MMIITVANTYEPGTVLGTSLYKLIYLSQQPYGGRDIIIIQFTDEETKAQRGWVRAWIPERTPTYRTPPSLVTVHMGDDLCLPSLHCPLSSLSADCISFISTATSLVHSSVESWGSAFKLCILPKVTQLLRGRARCQPRTKVHAISIMLWSSLF